MTFMIREYLGYYLIDSPSLERFKDQLNKSKVKQRGLQRAVLKFEIIYDTNLDNQF